MADLVHVSTYRSPHQFGMMSVPSPNDAACMLPFLSWPAGRHEGRATMSSAVVEHRRTRKRAMPMVPSFLVTKVKSPPVRHALINRQPLLTWLNQHRSVPVLLVSAGAGYGKTTLLSAWAIQCGGLVAWVSLDEQDNDLARFWTAVLFALRRCPPEARDLPFAQLETFHAPAPAELAVLLTTWLNDLAAREDDITLILDDYQVIEEPAIHASLQFVLDHLPASLHLVLSSRVDPPLALPRLRSRGQLAELRSRDLRFSSEESACFLREIMGLHLSQADEHWLAQRTEGWIAGLQLAALALHQRADPSAGVAGVRGGERFLREYVDEEILQRQPPALQRFLLDIAVLSRLNAALCQAVTEEQASQERLEALERANLFVAPLDTEQQWYRVHPLFQEALLARLQASEPERVPLLHQRAAAWYAEHGFLPEAIPHALAARDFTTAADLMERFVMPQRWRNDYHLLRSWAAQLPAAVLQARPELGLISVEARVFTSPRGPKTLEGVETLLHQVERGFRARDDQAGLGEALVMRAVLTLQQGAFAQAFALARQALAALPEDDLQWRSHALCIVGEAEAHAGQLERAQALLRQALTLYARVETLTGMQVALAWLGDVCLARGELHLAARYFHQALASAEEHPLLAQVQLTLQTGERENYYERLAKYGLATLAYEWNELAEAERTLREALAGPSEWRHILTGGVLLQVRLLLARGTAEEARKILADLAVHTSQPAMLRELQMCQAFVALADGDLVTAQRWATAVQPNPAPAVLTRREEEVLLLVRVRLAEGQVHDALNILAHWRQEARTAERHRSELQLLVLEALVHQACGASQQAQATLLQALRLARPEGYQRLFLDAGQALAPLLKSLVPALDDKALADYVRTLLRALVPAPASQETIPARHARDTPFLLVPLTPQEHRILQLLAEGASNQEIANQLVITRATAKKHVANILHKLGADNRTQAVARARVYALL